METRIYERVRSYAIAMAMYEGGCKYMDCLIPVVLQFVPEYDATDCATIKRDIGNTLDMPELVVEHILTIATERGYVSRQSGLYQLCRKAANDMIEKQHEVQDRIDATADAFSLYCRDEEHVFLGMSFSEVVSDFLDNTGFDLDFLRPGAIPKSDIMPPVEKKCLQLLVEFLRDPMTKPVHLETFQHLVMGYIVATALEWNDLNSVNIEKIKGWTIFLDTNVAFSLLGLHERRINKPILEMYKKLLKPLGLKLYVFDFTLHQMKRVVKAYSEEDTIYTPGIQRPSVHNTFKKSLWSTQQAQKYAEKLEAELAKKGISIYQTGFIPHSHNLPKDEVVADLLDVCGSLFSHYKPYTDTYGKQHDIAAIAEIRKMRGGGISKLTDAKTFFLTSDRRLAEFCHKTFSHGDERYVNEVALDMAFASMLWILRKDYKVQFSPAMIIAAFSRSLFISKPVWERFTRVLTGMMNRNRIYEHEIPNPFYKVIQQILVNFTEEDVHTITDSWIMARIAEADSEDQYVKNRMFELFETVKNMKDDAEEMRSNLENARDEIKITNESLIESEDHNSELQKKLLYMKVATIASVLFLVLAILIIIIK